MVRGEKFLTIVFSDRNFFNLFYRECFLRLFDAIHSEIMFIFYVKNYLCTKEYQSRELSKLQYIEKK